MEAEDGKVKKVSLKNWSDLPPEEQKKRFRPLVAGYANNTGGHWSDEDYDEKKRDKTRQKLSNPMRSENIENDRS